MDGGNIAAFACRNGEPFGSRKIVDRDQGRRHRFRCGTCADIADPRGAGTNRFPYFADAFCDNAITGDEKRALTGFQHARRAADGTVEHHATGCNDTGGVRALVRRGQGCGFNDDLARFQRPSKPSGRTSASRTALLSGRQVKTMADAAGGDEIIHRAAAIPDDRVLLRNQIARHRKPHAPDADDPDFLFHGVPPVFLFRGASCLGLTRSASRPMWTAV
jgi:hypothetical protein